MTNVHNLVKNEYEKRQAHANEILMSRKEEIYLKIPEIRDIDDNIYATGIKFNKIILLGKNDADNAAAELLNSVEKLKIRKLALLTQAGYPANYLEVPYKCTVCKDTGYISESGFEKCTCYKQQLIDLMYTQSNLKLAETENFSAFDEKCYPDITDEAKYLIKKSPRENILGIKEKCHKFIESFDIPEIKNLFFCGPAGVGKTFMANCVAYELMHLGKTVIYQPAPLLFEAINEHKQKSMKEDDYNQSPYKSIFNADLLIIDDLGIETQSAARYAELLNILNTRQSNNMVKSCKTIISTNISVEELYEYYTERVASRITGFFDVIRFAGEDIRRLKKLQNKQ